MAHIRNILRDGLEGLLATSEVLIVFQHPFLHLKSSIPLAHSFTAMFGRQMYYRQKGQRTPTRPQAIHENFDLCAEALVQRLTSYKTQSEEYHNSCIQGEAAWNDTFRCASFHNRAFIVCLFLFFALLLREGTK